MNRRNPLTPAFESDPEPLHAALEGRRWRASVRPERRLFILPEQHTNRLAIGAGVEAMLGRNWSLKLEYLYLDMPTLTTYNAVKNVQYAWNDSANLVRLGVSYRFGN